uniref:NMDA receptor synaptonuclear signaling and neuronal migration factor n=1 Tax=Sinocyclocheilus grahami TaxID=75366 RepID=A0A672QX88_SINGR
MGTAVSKRKNLRNDAISSVAAKVRAARAFGEYLHTHPENRNGSDHLLSDTLVGHDSDSPDSLCTQNNNFHSCTPQGSAVSANPSLINPALGLLEPPPPATSSKSRLSLERSFSAEEDQQKCVECSLQPARVYTITGESGMLGTSRGSKENLELEVLKGAQEANTSGGGSSGGTNPHQHISSAGTSAHNIRGWGEGKDCGLACEACPGAPSRSQGSLDLESSTREAGKQRRPPLERMCSVDRMTGLEREDNSWFPKENMFSFQTATTTMQAVFRSLAEKKRRKNKMESASIIQRYFVAGLSFISAFIPVRYRGRALTVQPYLAQQSVCGDLQTTCGTPEEGGCEDMDWEEEREMERLACEGDDFIPPKIMLISSKVPKAEYVPNIIRRGDTSIIPILYDHEHATFDDILEEIEKRLTAYRRGCKIWRMLIFCQGGPGHLYLLKNKVATFAKVEKEEDMSQFWKRLSRFMSKVNPEPNLIHIMGCYVLGNPNGEKLFQKLKNLMRPYSVTFESPLELSAQGKEMIEMYFDFRLFRLWKTRQHSKLLDYEDLV